MVKVKLFYYFVAILLIIQFAFPLATDAAAKYPEGTMVGQFSVAGDTAEQSNTSLTTEVTNWLNGEDIKLTSDFETLYIPRNAFQFDVNATLNELNEQTKRTWKNFFMRPKNVQVSFDVQIDVENEVVKKLQAIDYIDADATLTEAKKLADGLIDGEVSLIYKNEEAIPFETIHTIETIIPEESSDAVMSYAVKELNNKIITGNESFSFLEEVTFPGNLNHSNREMSYLASILYELLLHTNVKFIGKHSPLHVPVYEKTGLAVELDRQKEKDFIVYNSNELPIKILAEKEENSLSLSVQSIEVEETYQPKVTEVEKIKPRTIYRYSKLLNPGESDIIQEGENGAKVTVDRVTYANNNVFKSEERISEEIYVPKPRIVVISTTAMAEVELPEISEEDTMNDDIGADDMLTEEDERRTNEMRDFTEQINEAFDNAEIDEEFDGTMSTLLLLGFLDQLETFATKLEAFEERLTEIELEMNHVNEETKNMSDYQKELDEKIKELQEDYMQIIEMTLIGEED